MSGERSAPPRGERNAALVRDLWDAVSKSDVGAVERLCHEELAWHASGRGPMAGDHRGRNAVIEYLASIGEAADRFDSELEHVLVNDELVAVLFHVSGERAGRRLDTGFVLIVRVEGDRIAEVWAVPRDQHAVDAFWA